MLTETGTKDPNCKCPTGGRPRPNSILPEVTWYTCETQRLTDRKTITLGSAKTPKETNEWRDAKNLTTAIGREIAEAKKAPEPEKAKEINNTIGGRPPIWKKS